MDEGSLGGEIDNDRHETDDSQNLGFPPPLPSNENWRFQEAVGSRFILQNLETATIEDRNKVFLELKPHTLSLIKDMYGSHVIIWFFEHGLDLQRKELAEELLGHVYTLSFDQYGSRVIQKKIKIVRELENYVDTSVYDLDVIQKCVEYVLEEHIEIINDVDTCLYDPKASLVIEKCVEYVPEEHTEVIVSVCIDEIVKLAQNTCGTYIIQVLN
ncbi:pumilio homolog 2-like [Impatiens glandulifera]|uniref:pumilio homolog 2-like n=1 Tax=Impatiens glandulifera TaxID=253017 RepID=UPI001FB13675|nr:pumilio homolog 2-like [Impatiens glandulifera]